MDYAIYEDKAQQNEFSKYIGMIVIIFTIVFSVYTLIAGPEESKIWACIFILAVVSMGISMWARFTRKYLIYSDRLKIVKGGPFSTTIPFDNIEEVREATGDDLGPKSSPFFPIKNSVLMIRILESAMIITPSNREEFLRHLNEALSEWKNKMKVSTETNKGI